MSIFEQDLEQNRANFEPLSPVSFLRRAAKIAPNHIAIIDGHREFSYSDFWLRSNQLAAALSQRGIGAGDCVAILAGNIPEMLEAHNGVPILGAVLNSLNYRLDAATICFILNHGEAKAIIVDSAFTNLLEEVLTLLDRELLVVIAHDPNEQATSLTNHLDYESLLKEGLQNFYIDQPKNEWQAISLLYTSGTTGDPKGCVYHHRGAYLNALGNMHTLGLNQDSIYLWTLPMFHCDGWTFTWAVTAALATHVCLRHVDPGIVFQMIKKHSITHMCGAPIVLNMLAHASPDQKTTFQQEVHIATGGAAPPSAVIESMETHGFRVTHLYGLTETYGPATVCVPQQDWTNLAGSEKAQRMAKQGVHYVTLEDATIKNVTTMANCPTDGITMGEVMIRGNTVMKGYLKNKRATQECFAGGWFHSGDLGVQHPDNYIEVKDRSKDVIISGGENISSLEIEEYLYRHPDILEAAVVAQPDEKWGESPCAFITLHEGSTIKEESIIEYCRDNLARYKTPKTVIFGPLPKTSTGKIQKYLLRQLAAKRES
ncbi:MAG: acyl-CoA synthetase [Acidiferrobacteraceae bacterium]|nr:acyl-CoA synthetase [Acidiferrobacteraceae bacterium]